MVTKESLLERIIRDLPTAPHPSPFPVEENPFCEGPWFSIGRRAVEILKDVGKIQEFMSKYGSYIHEKFGLNIAEAERSAREVVGYCTGYVDDAQANRWFSALPEITHPIMGRERPFRGGDKVHTYFIVAQSSDQEIRRYLARTLSPVLSRFGLQVEEVLDMERSDNAWLDKQQRYCTFAIKPGDTPSFDFTGTYMFLAGITKGMEGRMKEEIGKRCKLSLETIRDQEAKG